MLKKFYLLMFFLINVFCNESQFNDAEIQEFNKKDCIVFENSKEDKNKLKKSVIIKIIVDNRCFSKKNIENHKSRLMSEIDILVYFLLTSRSIRTVRVLHV